MALPPAPTLLVLLNLAATRWGMDRHPSRGGSRARAACCRGRRVTRIVAGWRGAATAEYQARTGAKETTVFQRAITIYPWAALFIAFAPLGVRPAAGIGAALAVAIANLALVAAGVWLVGARAEEAGRARAHSAFLPGALLLAGPLALLALAAVTGEPTASRRAEFLVNATGLLLGALLLLLGFTLLAARLWAVGERALPTLGLTGLTVGTALWVANLVARYAVVASGAAGLHAAIEGDYWVASRYLLGLPGEPSWLAFLLVWLDMLQLAYLVAAYLCAAAFAAALARAGWLGRVGGRITTALGLALALAVVLGILLAAAGSRGGALLAFALTIPFMSAILPYSLGVALLGRGDRAAPAHPRRAAAATRTAA